MIPFSAALVAGFILCALLFLIIQDTALAFSVAFVLTYLFLPEGRSLALPGALPDISKYVIISAGCLAGTLIRYESLFQFRPHWSDLLIVALLGGITFTSITNGFGLYDGASNAFYEIFEFVIPVFLARVHLNTPRRLGTFLVVLVAGGTLYAPLVILEARLSPQFHNLTYGYFPHDWFQFQPRMLGFYRPIVFFTHALNLGRFLAFVTFAGALAVRKQLGRMLPLGEYYFLACGAAWLATLSYGPWLLLFLLVAAYLVFRPKIWWTYLIIPLAAFMWMTLVFMGQEPGWGAVDVVADLNTERAENLQYRLDALEEYRARILERPYFGHAGWGQGRIQNRATDSAFLVRALKYGLGGASIYFGWWLFATFVSLRVARNTYYTSVGRVVRCSALILPFAVAICMVDAALDAHVFVLAGSLVAVWQRMPDAVIVPRPATAKRKAMGTASMSGRSRTRVPRKRPRMA